MIKMIQCADLHLTSGEERGYSLSVLDEVLTITEQERAEYLLICGDLFDSFDDAVNLRAEFRSRIEAINSLCRIIFLPGNHEDLGKGNRSSRGLYLNRLSKNFSKSGKKEKRMLNFKMKRFISR